VVAHFMMVWIFPPSCTSRVAVQDELKLTQAEQIASKMLQQGFSTEQIAQLTSLSEPIIEGLKK